MDAAMPHGGRCSVGLVLLLAAAAATPLPPHHTAWGLNVHFVSNDLPGEIEQLAAAAAVVRVNVIPPHTTAQIPSPPSPSFTGLCAEPDMPDITRLRL